MNKYSISLRKNVNIAEDANTSKGNYDVVSFKSFRTFATRKQARDFKRTYKGSPVVIVNRSTMQVVR